VQSDAAGRIHRTRYHLGQRREHQDRAAAGKQLI
jgi:hypothetical protein